MEEEKEDNHFFIIGAQRSGSTYLYNLLDEHPEIAMNKPVHPEPKFFLNHNIHQSALQEYKKHYFPMVNKSKMILGEKSTSYLEYEYVAENIKSLFPGAKIICILRNPVQRAISNYKLSVANGLESRNLVKAIDLKTEEDIIPPKQISVSPFAYVSRGRYIEYLKPYERLFNQNLKLVVLEQLLQDPFQLNKLYKFLGVNSTFIPTTYERRFNTSESLEEAPPDLIEKLKSYYEPYNKELAETFNLSLEHWK